MFLLVSWRAMAMGRQWQIQDQTLALQQSFLGATERAPELRVASVVQCCLVDDTSILGNAIWVQHILMYVQKRYSKIKMIHCVELDL